MTSLQSSTVLVGRVLLGLIFVLSGFAKISGFDGTAGYIASKGMPLPQLVAALTIVVELGGGLALMAGLYTRQIVVVLAVFTLLAGVIFHNFWAAPPAEHMAQQINFLKNLSIAGGMLVLAAFGPGRLSLDARRLAAA
ncbi:MAG TPA: DoxX family protein [Caldimonas sp.]|jgi:putative oxidoreductase|nr:DoxX family protein [Caldimonas sp.]